MGCHATVKAESARLAPVRASWASGESVEWTKVYRLPEHTYFDHSAHLAVGVGCVTCHGRVDQMDVVRLISPSPCSGVSSVTAAPLQSSPTRADHRA